MMVGRLNFVIAAAALCIAVGCSSGGDKGGETRTVSSDVLSSGLVSQSDSLAYIVGMNIAEQLQKMDSTINVGVVCRAIMEQSEAKAVMSREEAREQFTRYLLYVEPERARGYEEKFLADLAVSDREFTRTDSGLTYHIEVIGDENLTPRNSSDWVTLKYTISRLDGESVVKSHTQSAALPDFIAGLEECAKLIGKGGKLTAYLPSKIAYGEQGDAELGVEPNETLLFEIEMVDFEKGTALKRKKEQALSNF